MPLTIKYLWLRAQIFSSAILRHKANFEAQYLISITVSSPCYKIFCSFCAFSSLSDTSCEQSNGSLWGPYRCPWLSYRATSGISLQSVEFLEVFSASIWLDLRWNQQSARLSRKTSGLTRKSQFSSSVYYQLFVGHVDKKRLARGTKKHTRAQDRYVIIKHEIM